MNRAAALASAFIIGAVVAAFAGEFGGLFDRDPTDGDLAVAQESGRAAAAEAADQRMQLEAERAEFNGWERGSRAASATISLDYIPNPSGLITGAMAGRTDLFHGLEQLKEEAWESGWEVGYSLGAERAWFHFGR